MGLLPLNNPQGYVHNWRYLNMQEYSDTVAGQSVGDSEHLLTDPDKPGQATVQVDVDLASIDTGMPELDTEATGKQWFNAPAFPTARFTSKSVKALGNGRYSVAGTLAIKGQSQEIVVPAGFTAQGNSGVMTGSFTIRRGAVAIGEGTWAAFDIVANDVQVNFKLAVAAR